MTKVIVYLGGWYSGEWEEAFTLIHQDNKNSYTINPKYKKLENGIAQLIANDFNESMGFPPTFPYAKANTKEALLLIGQYYKEVFDNRIEIIDDSISITTSRT